MDAVEYGKAKERMCQAVKRNMLCSDTCPLFITNLLKNTNDEKYDCHSAISKFPEQAVEAVEKWSKEHPVKTYLSVLLEKFPNVKLNNDDIPKTVCPNELFNLKEQGCPDIKCINCWNREYKEEE